MNGKNDQVGLGEFVLLAIVAGLVFSSVATCFDVLHNARDCTPMDLLIAIGFMAVPAVPATIIIAGGTVFVLGLYGPARDRRLWIPLLSSLTALALLGAVVARLQPEERSAFAWLLWPAFIPTAIVGFGTPFRHDALLRTGHAMIVALVGALVSVFLTCVVLAVNVALPSVLIYTVIPLVLVAFPFVAGRMIRKRLAGLGLALGGAAAVAGLAVSMWTEPAPAPASMTTNARPAFTTDTSAPTPNVIFIVLDTTRRDHLGIYGRHPTLTPRLDAFARDAVVYEDAYSTAPWTVPSHASMFTGLYPMTHGCTHEHHLWLDDRFVTLSDRLGALGYQTVALNSNPYLMETNLLQGFDSVTYLVGGYENLAVHSLALTIGVPERWVDKGSAEGIDELKKWLGTQRDPAKPFFLFVNLYEGHCEYVPPRSVRHELDAAGIGMWQLAQFWSRFNPNRWELTHKKDGHAQDLVGRLYAAEMRYQDRKLGELLDVLGARTNMDDALVMITADHGENLGEQGRWEHLHEINDTLIHVPLIVRYPNREYAGARQEGMCQLVDIVPTVFDVLGRRDDVTALPGRSLRPSAFEPYDAVFAQVAPYYLHFPLIESTLGFKANLDHFNRYRRVIRTGDMKYMWGSDGVNELFDIRRDPTESTNMIADQPDVARALRERLTSWWQTQPKYEPPPPSDDPKDGRSESPDFNRLRSLGYIGG